MNPLILVIEVVAGVTGIATPILYRRLRGGPLRLSSDGFLMEMMGFLLAIMITNPVGLLVGLALGALVPFSEPTFYASLAILNLFLGILGGWVWITVFLKPVNPSN